MCFHDPAIAQKVQDSNGMVTDDQLSAIDSIEMLDLFEWKRPRGIEGKPNAPLAEPRLGEKYPAFLKRITDRAYNTFGEHTSELDAALGNYLYT